MDEVLAGISKVGYVFVTLGLAAFVLLFHVLSDWRATPMGRHIMTFMGSMTALTAWSFVDDFLPRTIALLVWAPLIWTLAWAVWWRNKILINAQVKGRNRPPVAHDFEGDHSDAN